MHVMQLKALPSSREKALSQGAGTIALPGVAAPNGAMIAKWPAEVEHLSASESSSDGWFRSPFVIALFDKWWFCELLRRFFFEYLVKALLF